MTGARTERLQEEEWIWGRWIDASSGRLRLCELEISDINPQARRVHGGIWCEDRLPVTAWEVPEQRKVLPVSVQEWIGCAVPVIRVSKEIFRKQHEKHHDVLPMFEEFDLESWMFVRTVVDGRGRKWEFVHLTGEEHVTYWPLMTVLGEDSSGGISLVSMHRRNRRWLIRLRNGQLGFVERRR